MRTGTKAQGQQQYEKLCAPRHHSRGKNVADRTERAAERRVRRQGKKEALTCDC